MGDVTMSEQFKPGDMVKLKSGGPLMTVEHYDDMRGGVVCSWFNEKNERKQEAFAPDALGKEGG
jgi:uncharacterized protein YodC (DUF2158 family)